MNKDLWQFQLELPHLLYIDRSDSLMYHGRFKGTYYEAGYRYGQMIKKHGQVITSSLTFDITDEMIQFGRECLPIYKKF